MKNKSLRSFKISQFINEEAYGGVLLIIATIAALIWANSSFYESYHHIWHELKVGFAWGELNMIASLHHWINDGLMALFFFVIGLEIKREIMGGELSTIKKASLPISRNSQEGFSRPKDPMQSGACWMPSRCVH